MTMTEPAGPDEVHTARHDQLLVAADGLVRSFLGPSWRLLSTETDLEAQLTEYRFATVDFEEEVLVAILPIEVTHPAAILAAAILSHRLRHSAAAREYVDQDAMPDDTDEPPEAARYDA